ncbi:type 2 periplasmic-binding domain-containing protein [Luteipulveratus halotolerans]|uniref:Uncharacterized protein n=1 Tax=Luteipulveratus halotolerans TaxID=1631356 RepID=A0A0L6CK35_9MICO|nr:hypothetical protein [Luteipulveratus halotolerans]KNX38094.1 hypothetical protein VV01_14620 [Luteipulveratus halotolerans]
MPGLKTTSYGTGDYSWMLNTDGLDEAIGGVLDVSTFTKATHFPDGYFPSGLPVNVADRDVIKPWTDAAGAVLGFLKGDHKTDGVEDVNCAVVVRANIKTAKVPLAGFAVPSTAPQPRFAFWS